MVSLKDPVSSSSVMERRRVLLAFGMLFLLSLLIPSTEAARLSKLFPLRGLGGHVRQSWEVAEVIHQSLSWCVAVSGATDEALQAALDWACGTGSSDGNADCTGIQSSGTCYNPDTLKDHASYAFNQYYQKESQSPLACNFSGAATVVTTDPSSGSCTYPSSSSGLSTPTSTPTSTPSNFTTSSPPFAVSPATVFSPNTSHASHIILTSPIGWYNSPHTVWSAFITLLICLGT